MKKNLYLLYGISFLQGMVFYGSASVLYRQEAGLTIFQISVIESISLFLCLGMEIPWGILADKIGYRKTMIICSLFYFLSKIIFWKAWSFWDFLMERIFLSLAVSGFSGVDSSLLYLSAPKGRSQKVFGVYQGLGQAGLFLASLYFFLTGGARLRTAAFLTSLAYGAALFLCLFLLEPERLPQKESREAGGPREARKSGVRATVFSFLSDVKGTLSKRTLLLFLAGAGLLTETGQMLTVFLNQPKYIACGLSLKSISLIFIVAQAVGTIAPLSSFFCEKLGKLKFSACCFLFPGLFCFILGQTKSPVCSVVCILGIQCFLSLFQPLFSELQNREVHGANRASILSIQAMFLEFTGAVINPVFGKLADISLRIAFMAGGFFCCLGFFLFLFILPSGCLRRSIRKLHRLRE